MDKPKIVVVDDEPAIVELLTRFLTKKNYAITGFTSGKKAMAYLSARSASSGKTNNVDLLLTDMVMPEMSGIELIKTTLGLNPKLPVVLMTGTPDSELMKETVRLKISAYLTKPFQLDRLEHIIESILLTEKGVINHNK